MELPTQESRCLEHCGPGRHPADMSQSSGNAKSAFHRILGGAVEFGLAAKHLSQSSQAARLLRARALHGMCGRFLAECVPASGEAAESEAVKMYISFLHDLRSSIEFVFILACLACSAEVQAMRSLRQLKDR